MSNRRRRRRVGLCVVALWAAILLGQPLSSGAQTVPGGGAFAQLDPVIREPICELVRSLEARFGGFAGALFPSLLQLLGCSGAPPGTTTTTSSGPTTTTTTPPIGMTTTTGPSGPTVPTTTTTLPPCIPNDPSTTTIPCTPSTTSTLFPTTTSTSVPGGTFPTFPTCPSSTTTPPGSNPTTTTTTFFCLPDSVPGPQTTTSTTQP